MAYEKQTWANGDVITAAKLNHMEDGIGSCVMVVNAAFDETSITLDKTWQEIHDAMASGKIAITRTRTTDTDSVIMHFIKDVTAEFDGVHYDVTTDEDIVYTASTANDYPTYEFEEG